jgi:hypothetical protein
MTSRGTTASLSLSQPRMASHSVMWSVTPTVTMRNWPLEPDACVPEIWMTSLPLSLPRVSQVGPGPSST